MRKLKIVLYIFVVICLITNCNKQEYDKQPLQLYYTDVYVNYLEDEKLEEYRNRRRPLMFFTIEVILPSKASVQDKNTFLEFIGKSNCVFKSRGVDYPFFKFNTYRYEGNDTLVYSNSINFKEYGRLPDENKSRKARTLIVSLLENPESEIILYSDWIKTNYPFYSPFFEFEIERSEYFNITYMPIEALKMQD